jgi:hypothetical protein
MLPLEDALVEHLRMNAPVAALVGTRVHPAELPERPTYPAIVYRRIGRSGVNHTEGPSGLAAIGIQIDCWAMRYRESKALAAAVSAALDGFKGLLGGSVPVSPCLLEDHDDDFDPELKAHGSILVFTLWAAES